ncbi:MAG: hypothetical protein ABIO83_02415 [Ilumatobacteraceae bacterium]
MTDHGVLTGLADDDHTQYALADGTRGTFEAAGAAAAAQAASQPLDADLTALAASGNSAVLAATTASFLLADETKLDGIQPGAIANVIEDATPQLGGDLDLNGNVVTGLVPGVDVQAYAAVLAATTASFLSADRTKLDGVATGATANSSDATLLARANHTGTQANTTITGLGTISTQAASGVAITGGSVVGITDITVADGGTGASTAALARVNLELSRFTSQAGIPSSTPAVKGDWNFDTTNNAPYVARGTASSADWQRVPMVKPATTQTGTTYTLALADRDTLVLCSNAALVTVTVPTNASVALVIGYRVLLQSTGAGGVTLSTTGITLNGSSPKKTIAQNQGLYLEKTATDTWTILGGTAA